MCLPWFEVSDGRLGADFCGRVRTYMQENRGRLRKMPILNGHTLLVGKLDKRGAEQRRVIAYRFISSSPFNKTSAEARKHKESVVEIFRYTVFGKV